METVSESRVPAKERKTFWLFSLFCVFSLIILGVGIYCLVSLEDRTGLGILLIVVSLLFGGAMAKSNWEHWKDMKQYHNLTGFRDLI